MARNIRGATGGRGRIVGSTWLSDLRALTRRLAITASLVMAASAVAVNPTESTMAVTPLGATAVPLESQRLLNDGVELEVKTIARGLEHPWGMSFLPDGSLLVSERPGRLRLVTPAGVVGRPLAGLPTLAAGGEGGLLDVLVPADYSAQPWVYLSLSEPAMDGGTSVAVVRARLKDDRITDRQVIFRQSPKLDSQLHYGSRLVATPDGHLFITLGDRSVRRADAQTLDNHNGKVVRVLRDGGLPSDNPFSDHPGALPEIWTLGHRNSQGAALHPLTGQLWLHEHGPKGGDEINLIEPGRNFGWPVISHGEEHEGGPVGEGPFKPGLEQPIYYWSPSIAPSGMAFYQGDLFPSWHNNLLVGALAGKRLVRLEMNPEGRIVREERLLGELGYRIRDVEVGPDGAVYLLTDAAEGRLLRLAPIPSS